MPENSYDSWLIPLSFFIVYIVWGSTYLANAWAVEVVPPFLFAGCRFVIAGVLLLLLTRIYSPIHYTSQQLFNSFYAGFMLFAVGNGLVVWALIYIDSGITSLIIAMQPLVVALMLWGIKKQRPNRTTWIGIVLGIIGMTILVGQPNFNGDANWLLGLAGILTAVLAWGYASIWLPDADLPPNVLQSSSFQMIFGGILMLIISSLWGESDNFQMEEINSRVIWSFLFLVIFGSILAFSAFNYLLKKVSPTKVVSSAYINPLVALFLGWWLNNENISMQSFLAIAFLLTGVVFIIRAKERTKSTL